MRLFPVATVVTLLSVAVSGTPAIAEPAVKAPTPNTPSTIVFCTEGVGCNYPALTIVDGACVNFNDYLSNAVRAAIIPNGFVCTVFLIPGCSYRGHSMFGQPDPVVQDIPAPFYENTNSFKCSPF
ncbi:hypothetical protein D9613_007032 [Agrocybe pediades]|uniref:Uncharacterized protein n=1 Tax=Agrocybe pediades TaxID=84607 RepID=A0A8H4VJQ9_9AGAR|nr:hypothetical protein D9613_007032 [Agrocybe pediades]